MTDNQNENLQPNENGQDTTMVYFNPDLMQSIANVTARKREGFREMQAAAEDGDLDAEYRLALSYANGEDGAPVEFYVAKQDYEPELNGTGRVLLIRYAATISSFYNPYLGNTKIIAVCLGRRKEQMRFFCQRAGKSG